MNDSIPVIIALSKGKLLEPSLQMLERVGFDLTALRSGSRRLMVDDPQNNVRFLSAKGPDVPVYVEHGVADVGIAGRDVVAEARSDVLIPLFLGFGRCRMVIAAPRDYQIRDLRLATDLRVATKYPHIAQQWFRSRGLSARFVGLGGSVELAPEAGLADIIVDIVETGRTLRENNLVELKTILEIEACLLVNRASHKLRLAEIDRLVTGVERAITTPDQPEDVP